METEGIKAALAASVGLHLAVAAALSTLPSPSHVSPGEVVIPVGLVLSAPAGPQAGGGETSAHADPTPAEAAASEPSVPPPVIDEVERSPPASEEPRELSLSPPLPPPKPERLPKPAREPAETASPRQPRTDSAEPSMHQPPELPGPRVAEPVAPTPSTEQAPSSRYVRPSRTVGSSSPRAPGDGGGSGLATSSPRGAGDAAAAGSAQERSEYFARLQTWLERHKRYPRMSQVRGEEGTALLRFTVDRSGRVLSHRLDRSAGHPSLDREVAAMIERAQPLPPIPEAIADQVLDIAIPVSFVLR